MVRRENVEQVWDAQFVTFGKLRIPVDAGHQFRSMSGQDSGPCPPTIPEHAGQGK